MFTIGLLGQKGGTGKTTVAISLAVEIARAGHTVVLIDIDPQANTTSWKGRRVADNPVVVAAQATRLRHTLDLARENGADFAVIDSPGHNDHAATETGRCSDIVLIPSRPKVFDLETLPAVRELLRVAGTPPSFVLLNGLHPAARNAAAAAKSMIERISGFPACPAHLSQRDIYGNAPANGQAAQEMEPAGAAAAELKNLYMWICQQVDMLGGRHGEKHSRQPAESA